MNFIKEINGFERWLESHYLPTNAQLLWYKLFMLSNRAGWPEWIQVDNQRLMAVSCINNKNTFLLARDKLLDSGLAEFTKGKKGSPNRYKLASLEKFGMSHNLHVEPKSDQESGDIYKSKKIKTKQNKDTSTFDLDKALTEYADGDRELLGLLNDFAQMRQDKKKPLSASSIKVLFKTLARADSRQDKIAALEKSILNSYQGVFLPERKQQPPQGSEWAKIEAATHKKKPWANCPVCTGTGFYEVERTDKTTAMAYCDCWQSEGG